MRSTGIKIDSCCIGLDGELKVGKAMLFFNKLLCKDVKVFSIFTALLNVKCGYESTSPCFQEVAHQHTPLCSTRIYHAGNFRHTVSCSLRRIHLSSGSVSSGPRRNGYSSFGSKLTE